MPLRMPSFLPHDLCHGRSSSRWLPALWELVMDRKSRNAAVQGTLKSLLQRFEGISFSVLSLHYGPTLTYMTTGKTITLTFVGKAMSLLFNMLSSFVIAFLPMKEGVGSQREELCPWQRS